MDSFARLGANHSDTFWYREDLQRRMADEDAFSCLEIYGLEYQERGRQKASKRCV